MTLAGYSQELRGSDTRAPKADAGEQNTFKLVLRFTGLVAFVHEKEKKKATVVLVNAEDHIGALPYLLKDVRVPVYAPPYAAALIEDRLAEHRIKDVDLQISPAGLRDLSRSPENRVRRAAPGAV